MFTVIYRWKLKQDHEQAFKEGWSEIIHRNIEKYGALGSRLHKGEDGLWVSYSQWTSHAHWLAARNLDDAHEKARKKMVHAILKQYDPIILTPVLDHLIATDTHPACFI